MLIYKRISKKIFRSQNTQNFFSSIVVWLFNLPFIIVSGIYFHNTKVLIVTFAIFGLVYLYFYKQMFYFKIPFLQKKLKKNTV